MGVRLTKKRIGIIRYIGVPHFAKDKSERIGIELDQMSAKGHDGRVGKIQYFSTKRGLGTFVTRTAIIEKLEAAKKTPPLELSVGDYVLLKDDKKGTVRFIGITGIVKGSLAGIELDEASPSAMDGIFGGTQYFECEYGHGLFARLWDITEIIKKAEQQISESS